VLLLSACAAGPDPAPAPEEPAAAEGVARLWAGDYAGRARGDAASELVRMQVRLERAEPGAAELAVLQSDGGDRRRFRIALAATRLVTRLSGSFAPLNEQGERLGSCPLSVRMRASGFVASTSAATCRFERGGRALGLVKEIAHDGARMVIADRVVDAESGESVQPDRVIELHRVRAFEAFAGVRADGEQSWRVARAFRIRSDGSVHEPADSGGMPLGLRLELAPYLAGDGGAVALRLRVFDAGDGELLGQAWADPAAAQLGIAVPGVQVGLRAARSER
jgi:hypothetical protein